MTRICFVSLPIYGYFNHSAYETSAGGGAKRQIYLLTQELQNEFDICAVVGDYGQPRREERDGVVLHRAYTPQEESAPARFLKLINAMRRADADVYIYRGHPRKAAFVYLIATLLRADWVYNVSNDSNLGYNYTNCSRSVRWLFSRGLEDARVILAQTQHQHNQLRKRFGVESTIVPNGYPPVAEDIETEREYFLWIGRIDPEQKRPHIFLECAEELPDQQFVLIGPRSDEEYARRIENKSSSLPNVRYVGPVTPDEVHGYYSRAVALVNTSAHEGFPNTFLEAWRYGTPVVSLDVDPGRYLDNRNYDGFAQGDTEELIEKLARLAMNNATRFRIGQSLQSKFEQQYSIGEVADQYADALRQGTIPQR